MINTDCNRVLWLVQGSCWIGSQQEFLNLAKRLPHGWKGCLVFLRTPENIGAIRDSVASRDVAVCALGMSNYREFPKILVRFLRILRWFRPVVVHSHHPPANFLNSISNILIGGFSGRSYRTVIAFRNSKVGLRLRARLIERFNVLVADQVLCSSTGVEQSFFGDARILFRAAELRASNRKHWTLFNSIDVNHLRHERDSVLPVGSAVEEQEKTYRIICVAAFKEQKGHRTLLEAFRRLCLRLPNVELLLLGDGPLRFEMEGVAKSLNICKRCFFCGYQPNPVANLMSADVFVSASYWEGLPKALLEAMALDVPCVTTDVSGAQDIFSSDMLVPPGDSAALAGALEAMLVDCQSRIARVEAQRAVIQRFDIDSVASIFFGVYGQSRESTAT